MAKKVRKIVLIVLASLLGLIIATAAVVTVWQWRNIKALYIAMTSDEETINQQLMENDDKLVEEIRTFMSNNIRDFTDEEQSMIDSGEKTKTEVLAEIIAESVKEQDEQGGVNSDTQGEAGEQNAGTNQNATTSTQKNAEQIVAKHVANLYSYQSQFEGRISSLAATVKAYARSYKATHDCTWRDAKVATVQSYSSKAMAIESECYAKVDAEVAALRAELKAIGADTSIADQVQASAETQMQLKKSQIMSQYAAKMNS